MTQYPKEVDLPAYLADAVAFLRGHGNKNAIVHDGWEAGGFALSKYLPYDPATGASKVASDVERIAPIMISRDSKEAADTIEAELNKLPKTGPADFGSPDWQRMLALVLQVWQMIQSMFLNDHI